jgi:hypothetical protein
VKTRREIDDDESDDDDNNIKKAKIDRNDESMNDLNEVDRRDFFKKKDFSKRIHLSID